jgi:hypothetical protein
VAVCLSLDKLVMLTTRVWSMIERAMRVAGAFTVLIPIAYTVSLMFNVVILWLARLARRSSFPFP